MTSESSAYPRFKRSLATGNLHLVLAAAAELPWVGLRDALEVCLLLRDEDQDCYERAAVRWTVERYGERSVQARVALQPTLQKAIADCISLRNRTHGDGPIAAIKARGHVAEPIIPIALAAAVEVREVLLAWHADAGDLVPAGLNGAGAVQA